MSSSSRYVTPVDPAEKEGDIISRVCHWLPFFSVILRSNSLQRNLNNAFAYDLVPSVEVLSAALRAARRVNDFPTAVRIFEGAP